MTFSFKRERWAAGEYAMASFSKNISMLAQGAALYRDGDLCRAGVTGYQAKYLLAVSNDEGISQDGLARRVL